MTDLISLRALEPEDLDLLYRIENDQTLWGVGVSNVPYSRYVLRDYIANATGDIYTDRQVRLIVENREGQTVGLVDLVSFDPAHRRAEVGIVILREHRRHGYAGATLREVTDYALRILHLHQLYVYVASDNEASLQLFQKAGFMLTATLRHWLFDGQSYQDACLLQIFL
jgi:diamine N-acetyltransferase